MGGALLSICPRGRGRHGVRCFGDMRGSLGGPARAGDRRSHAAVDGQALGGRPDGRSRVGGCLCACWAHRRGANASSGRRGRPRPRPRTSCRAVRVHQRPRARQLSAHEERSAHAYSCSPPPTTKRASPKRSSTASCRRPADRTVGSSWTTDPSTGPSKPSPDARPRGLGAPSCAESRSITCVRDRSPLAAVPRALNRVLARIDWRAYTHIGKLDADVELPRGFLASAPARLRGGPVAGHDGRGDRPSAMARMALGHASPPTHAPPLGPVVLAGRASRRAAASASGSAGTRSTRSTSRMLGVLDARRGGVPVRHLRVARTADGRLRGRVRGMARARGSRTTRRSSCCCGRAEGGRDVQAAGPLRARVPRRLCRGGTPGGAAGGGPDVSFASSGGELRARTASLRAATNWGPGVTLPAGRRVRRRTRRPRCARPRA